ncbi:MAG: phosphotransferase [Marinobacter sp.]|uniref:phosphotransferase n=1 Tax=Marinobacter sp. TaxID=50741 RepID=UPI003297E62E|tara:strand:+ start:3159 stop:4595 length:1437 start_codon:yes stop_codon:yes gene_type:complete
MSSRDFHVLCIEDEEEIRDFLFGEIERISNNRCCITFARSRDEALSLLKSGQFFDYVTLDLTIPVTNGSFEKSPANGLAVLGESKNLCPGAPTLILTGTGTLRMISQFLETSNNVDIWSEGNTRPTVSFLEKADINDFSEKIAPCISAVSSLSDIELNLSFDEIPISHDRLIRIFAKKNGAGFVEIDIIGGGYSDAKVYSLSLTNEHGIELHRCIAKCGKRLDIDIDSNNFNRLISRLKPEATPRQLDHLRFGAGQDSAVFYGLATEHNHSFFSACKEKLVSHQVLRSLEDILSNWHDRGKTQRIPVREIRQKLISDEAAQRIINDYNISRAKDFEKEVVQCRISCTHGDLHGENVLVDTDNEVTTLIDYGDVKEQCAIVDPLTLECSFLFHTSSPYPEWPSNEALRHWTDLNSYLQECPYSDEIGFCREWIRRIGVGNRELAACLYSYALRQLKYDDTDESRALNLIDVAFDLYERS